MFIENTLIIAGEAFTSRLFVGTGKFASYEIMNQAIKESGTQMVTVSLRRVDLKDPTDNLLNIIDIENYKILPNTAGAKNAAEAVRLARLAKASGISNWIKLEVTPESRFLLPDGEETLAAAKILVKEGFVVLPYIQPDFILAKKLEDIGCATVMPLASPIGSNRGIRNRDALQIIIDQINIPVVIDAGLGKPSDAALAMEMGADAVLVNTSIATATDPISMAKAFRFGTEAGFLARRSGVPMADLYAHASSPLDYLSQV